MIQHEKNYERARSRNTGMDNAKGDFLTFLDSDDFMYPQTLADAAQFAAQNPSFRCFHNLYELVDAEKKLIHKSELSPIGDRVKAIAKGNFMSCIGNFIHRDIYTKYRFDTFVTLTGSEDWEFWLRVLADYDVGRIEKVNCGALHHENRTVLINPIGNFQIGFEYLLNKIRQDPHLFKVYGSYINDMETSSLLYLGILSNSAGLFTQAQSYLKMAARKNWKVIFTSRFLRILRRSILRLPDNA